MTRGGFGLEVTFAVEPGQVVGVLGPNGAGKSTLLKALAGLIPVVRRSDLARRCCPRRCQDQAVR